MDGLAGFIGAALLVLFVLWLYVLLPASMAGARGRSAVGWVLLTWIFSPLITIIALLVLGPTVERALAEMREDDGD